MIRLIKYLTICILPCCLNAIDWVGSYTIQGSTLFALRQDTTLNAIWLGIGEEIGGFKVLGNDEANRLLLRAKDGSIIKLSFATPSVDKERQAFSKELALSMLRKRFIETKPTRIEHNVDSLLNDPTYPAEIKKRIRDAIDRAHKKAETIATRVAQSDGTESKITTQSEKGNFSEVDQGKPLVSEFIPPNKSDFDPALTQNLSDADWTAFWMDYVRSRQAAQEKEDSKKQEDPSGTKLP